MNGLKAIVIDWNVYVPEESQKPCENCDLKIACNHGMLAGRACSLIDENECFRFSQSLTDKLNKE